MDAAALAHALGATRSGRQWKCKCVAHEDSAPSMIIFDGRERVQVRCLAGCEQVDLIAALKARGLWSGEPGRTEPNHVRPSSPVRNPEAERMQERARRIWDQTVDCAGTMAEDYLDSREIWTVAKELPATVRFHPSCPRGHELVPAVVVAMRDVHSNAMHAIQRIYLKQPAPRSNVVKDGTPMMLGTAGGCAMKLGSAKGYIIEGVDLHICEGLESGLSIMAMCYSPVWAMGSTSLIRSLPVLDGVQRLMIWTDHDVVDPRTGKRPGASAAQACGERWMAADREVMLQIADKEGDDPNDVWRDRCGRL